MVLFIPLHCSNLYGERNTKKRAAFSRLFSFVGAAFALNGFIVCNQNISVLVFKNLYTITYEDNYKRKQGKKNYNPNYY